MYICFFFRYIVSYRYSRNFDVYRGNYNRADCKRTKGRIVFKRRREKYPQEKVCAFVRALIARVTIAVR